MERLVMSVPAVEAERRCDVFVAALAPAALDRALVLERDLRAAGLRAMMDHEGRGLKSQMKRADKLGARYVAIMGEDEQARGEWTVRDMAASSQEAVPADEASRYLKEKIVG
jgi:histidyl-tRNA synthetase